MKIKNIQVLKGPNYWSVNHKVIVALLDIERFEELPTDRIDGFYERMKKLLPGLYEHQCSEDHPGGFFERVIEGTWMGHVVEHLALELETLAGLDCSFGKTTGTDDYGVYNVAFAWEIERAGFYALNAAIRIAEALSGGKDYDIEKDISAMREIIAADGLGPSTSSIVNAAVARNIPYIRLDEGSMVQLGYGSAQKRIHATCTDLSGNIAVELASDKNKTKAFLNSSSVPVPEGYVIYEAEELDEVISSIGFPVVIKPNDANQGKGITLNIYSREQAVEAFGKAKHHSAEVLVEKYIKGKDYRLLVINYRLVAAALRTPAMVTGDGRSAIRDLVRQVNNDPSRGDDHERILTKIRIDSSTDELLKLQDMSLDSVPPAGMEIFLRQTANLSTGGTSEDVTDIVHPDIILLAERVARIIGLDICGIDFICEDISEPLKKGKGAVLEVNAAPGFRMHTNPYKGKPRNAGEAVVNMLFPGHNDGRIPIVAITGTNGKTTTTRLIAHIASKAGFNVGYTTTDGIYIAGDLIEEGDCTGPVSAEKVLRDRSVNFAVLECARGGMLRSGLAFDRCDTGIVTNVAEDHLGMKGINTLDEMARVKSIIPESVSRNGMAILNANNEATYAMRKGIKCVYALFSINPHSQRIAEHCLNGGVAAIYRERHVVLMKGNEIIISENVDSIPVAFGGNAPFMIENILASMLGAYSRDIDPAHIVEGLRTFIPSFKNMPGRMNLIPFRNFSFLLDYAHNFHGISALGEFIKPYKASSKTGIIAAAGDRRDIDIINVGKASAEIFDRIIIRTDEDNRGRTDDENVDLILTGIRCINQNTPVIIIKNEAEAVRYAINEAVPASLIVLFADKIRNTFEVLEEFRQKENEPVDKLVYL
jgi:cyanophycin synthetase